jgi:DNA-binding GntR family transcriptional regulator
VCVTITETADAQAPVESPIHGQRSDSAGKKVYRGLRDQILSGQLEVGTWLVEVQIAEEFGVSRTPVREALRRLIDERLVAHDAYRGAVVRGISAQEALEIGQIHEIHDGLAARLAVQKVDQAGIDQLKDLIEEMRERIAHNDWDGAASANEAFHGFFYQVAGNSRLSGLAGDLSLAMRRFSAGALADPERAAQVIDEHQECVRALATRDPDQAEQAARKHGRACMSWTGSWLDSNRQVAPLKV